MRYVEEDVTMYAGPKGKHGTIGSVGYRHGGGQTTVVMGGKDIHVERPRARAANGSGEFPLPSLGKFQSEDPINDAIMSVPGSMPIQLKGTPKMLFVQAKARSAPFYQGNGQDDGGVLYKGTLRRLPVIMMGVWNSVK